LAVVCFDRVVSVLLGDVTGAGQQLVGHCCIKRSAHPNWFTARPESAAPGLRMPGLLRFPRLLRGPPPHVGHGEGALRLNATVPPDDLGHLLGDHGEITVDRGFPTLDPVLKEATVPDELLSDMGHMLIKMAAAFGVTCRPKASHGE
jgi:hypothetical protein